MGITALAALEELDLTNNDVAALPPEMGHMSRLRSLMLEGNCLRVSPRPPPRRRAHAPASLIGWVWLTRV